MIAAALHMPHLPEDKADDQNEKHDPRDEAGKNSFLN